MKKNIIYTVLLSLMIFGNTGCKDYYQELNQDPANVAVTDPKGLMAEAVLKFQPYDYLIWYYNIDYTCRWIQMGMPSGTYKSFESDYYQMKETGGQGSQYLETLRYRNKIRDYISKNPDDNNLAYEAVCTVLSVYLAVFDIDMFGAIPYKDACKYDPTLNNIEMLTPDYQMVDELYKIFLEELDGAIKIFQNENNYLKTYPEQDVVYNGDLTKWARLANSLKLKIAVRTYLNDAQGAISLVESVVGSSVGYISESKYDFLFCKALKANNSSNDDFVYGTGNSLATIGLTEHIHKFLLDSRDPRLRFIYTKNALNSKVIQAFIDAKCYDSLPKPVRDVVILDEKGNFKAWGGLGEPWVRYQSIPVVMNGKDSAKYKNVYFNGPKRYTLVTDPEKNTKKEYNPFSYQSNEMKKGREVFTLPTVGKDDAIEDKVQRPLYSMYMTSAEVNLYLAEFKMLGANLPNSAAGYYNAGVEESVVVYDKLADLNKIPYYGTTYNNYDPCESVIDLMPGETSKMLASGNVKFEGSDQEKLEKIYLQQLIHFSLMSNEQFVTARRSGYPKIDSKLLPMIQFENVIMDAVPRRFELPSPSSTDKMYDKQVKAYEDQGLSYGLPQSSSTEVNYLNKERLWQDKNGPQWGSGK